MARRKGPNASPSAPKARGKKGEGTDASPIVVPAAQVASAEMMREAMDRLIEADKAAKAAKKPSNSKTSGYRSIFKEAVKTTGFSNDAVSWFIENRERSPEDIDAETRDRNRVAKFMNMPIGGQLGLLEDGSSVADMTERDRMKDSDPQILAACEAQGMEAGEGATNFNTNPYPEGSKRAGKWGKGWLVGNAKNAPDAAVTKQPTHESAHA